jgi:hypothetical protein
MNMQRSSGSIGTLAAALAKAQGELTNPEKSLVGTIRSNGPGEAERVFRYASLSSGLDIVRKVLGQQEIATGQDDIHRSGCGHRKSNHRAGARFGGMDCLRLADLCHQ